MSAKCHPCMRKVSACVPSVIHVLGKCMHESQVSLMHKWHLPLWIITLIALIDLIALNTFLALNSFLALIAIIAIIVIIVGIKGRLLPSCIHPSVNSLIS